MELVQAWARDVATGTPIHILELGAGAPRRKSGCVECPSCNRPADSGQCRPCRVSWMRSSPQRCAPAASRASLLWVGWKREDRVGPQGDRSPR